MDHGLQTVNVARNDTRQVHLPFVRFEAGPRGTAIIQRETVPFVELPQRCAHRILPSKDAAHLMSFTHYRTGATRGKAGVHLVHAIVLDFDSLDLGDLSRLGIHIAKLGLGYWLYTTWSHHDPFKSVNGVQGPFDSFRMVFPLSTAPEVPDVWERIYPLFVADILPAWWAERYPQPQHGQKARGLDPASASYAQGWFEPACPLELIDQAKSLICPGAPVDVAAYLRRAPAEPVSLVGRGMPLGAATTPVERIYHALIRLGKQPFESGPNKWSCLCPSHPEENPSFGFSEGDDGKALVNCLAGCSANAIASSLGLHMRDLFPSKPEVVISTDEHRTNDAAVRALALDAELYHRGGRLVALGTDGSAPELGVQIRYLDRANIRERLTRQADFMNLKRDREGNEIKTLGHPPDWCVGAVEKRGEWPGIRPLSGIILCPTMRDDGTILQVPGYDAATGLYLDAPADAVTVPDHPTQLDAELAAQRLAELFCNFPFEDRAQVSVVLSGMLSPVAYLMIKNRNVPIHAFDATKPASGKTKLAVLAVLIATGAKAEPQPWPSSNDELGKTLGAFGVQGRRTALFDNVSTEITVGPLDAVVTGGGKWTTRVLGRNELCSPVRTLIYVSGNQLGICKETGRRTLLARITPDVPNPEDRTEFVHADLEGHVTEHQRELLGCVLTILRGHHLAGRPLCGVQPLGSFEDWSKVVAAALVWAGQPDPTHFLAKRAAREIDPVAEAEINLFEYLYENQGLTAHEIVSGPSGEDLDRRRRREECVMGLFPNQHANARAMPSATVLGYRLRKLDGVVHATRHGDLRMPDSRNKERAAGKGSKRWFVELVRAPRLIPGNSRGDQLSRQVIATPIATPIATDLSA